MKNTMAARGIVESLTSIAEDQELAARISRGEAPALDQLVQQYADRVVHLATRLLASRELADDVAQDVFVALLNQKSSYRGDAGLWTYLAAITIRRCRSMQRRRWIHDKVMQAASLFMVKNEKMPNRTESSERAAAVRETTERSSC
jgi:RNA polymerase sigma-70 factor (ECF subfamily)